MQIETMPKPSDQPPSKPASGLHAISSWRPDTAAWREHTAAAGRWLTGQLRRPRTRLGVIGAILLLLALLGITTSMWTLPAVIVGAAMVLIAWIGSRLEGRFAVAWGEHGTELEFRAEIRAPEAPARPQPAATEVTAPRLATLAKLEDRGVIEGEAHTVEIDVAELKALIVAAEAAEADGQRPAA